MTAISELRALGRLRLLQLLTLTGMFVLVGVVAFQLKFFVLDLDIWWHLRVGDWIVQHGGFPHTGILSRSAATRPWAAYSWGYEVLLSRFYGWFGLLGVGIYGTLLTLMVSFSVYWMARQLSQRFWVAYLLTAACCYSFLFSMMPRPVFFSIALFCVVLTLLLEAQRANHVQTLYWMPLIFLLWANLHIQFIYGLAVIGLYTATNLLLIFAGRSHFLSEYFLAPALSGKKLILIFLACFAATLVGPYSYHLYAVIFDYSRSQLIYSTIKELQPLSFRTSENYVELLLAGAAFSAVAWHKKIDLFKLTMLVMTSVVAFRAMRDSWFLCIAAAACIADAAPAPVETEQPDSALELTGVLTCVALLLVLFARGMDVTNRGLDRAISSTFPVNAVNFVHQNGVPGPLYNNFDWGGFLSWYLPEYPVAIDGRTDLYGDELDTLLLKTQSGEAVYKNNPYLNDAGVVLLRRSDGLVSVLELDPRFRKIYEDGIATVFARQ
jgi:hypothetical protein